ncbi:hypothetical protein EW026_g5205 [Hermanssonia centrifuga]|uniref:Uncharacterized protein n=1 Tax=Hermanssonia centrifuga TaxID=98765 RepID=A0A4S4KFS0_9APHY|nr:hypothetical protein EW026_g5205 [Hermanssonia centrifuga]
MKLQPYLYTIASNFDTTRDSVVFLVIVALPYLVLYLSDLLAYTHIQDRFWPSYREPG